MSNTYVNKVELADGSTLMDISDSTVTASDVLNSKIFYSASGQRSQGTASGGATDYTVSGAVVNFTTNIAKPLSVMLPGVADTSSATVTRTGKNMLDPDIGTYNGYYNDSGVLQPSTGTLHTDLIPVVPSQDYTLYMAFKRNSSGKYGIYYWNANKEFISRQVETPTSPGVLFQITMPSTCHFVSFQVPSANQDLLDLDGSKLVHGTATSATETYTGATYPLASRIYALIGENNVWSDAGDIDVVYWKH